MRTTRDLSRNRNRRGAEAIEFAMVSPILIMLVFGSIDYGLYFWQQFRATNAILSAMRTGGLTAPPDAEVGAGRCSTCISTVESEAVSSLADVGINVDASEVRPSIVGVNGVCTLVVNSTIDYSPITGMFRLPDNYEVNIQVVAQGAKGC